MGVEDSTSSMFCFVCFCILFVLDRGYDENTESFFVGIQEVNYFNFVSMLADYLSFENLYLLILGEITIGHRMEILQNQITR